MTTETGITKWFGVNLAILLSEKILQVYPQFDQETYVQTIKQQYRPLTYTQRVELHANALKRTLVKEYPQAINILTRILGEPNPNQTGMFTQYYWVLPVAKFVEIYGLEHVDISLNAIEQITQRCTGEYAIRPFIRHHPKKTLQKIKRWAQSSDFHLRRLASEGLRPKLPWATKLDVFIDNPKPIFFILELIKEDPVKFVQKSVANCIADYLKVNPKQTLPLLKAWKASKHPSTQWICRHATRNLKQYQIV
ncbi:MAG: DNA alkylation repair protein [Candidatus Woesearchaeota archaeon]